MTAGPSGPTRPGPSPQQARPGRPVEDVTTRNDTAHGTRRLAEPEDLRASWSPPPSIELRVLVAVAAIPPKVRAGCPKIARELDEPEPVVRHAIDALEEVGAVSRDDRNGHVMPTPFGIQSLEQPTELRLRLVERRSELAEVRHRRELEVLRALQTPRRSDRPRWRRS